jgi:hypothetical protein
MKSITLVIAITLLLSCNNKSNKETAPVDDASKPDSGVANLAPLKDSTQRAAEFQNSSKPDYVSNTKKSEKDIVFEILTSSPRYIALTKGLEERVKKNGGSSFGIILEGSPNPKKDEALAVSENYDFNVHETYPDRNVTLARFSFSKKDKQLYEYDVANDTLKAISFSKNLLSLVQ